MRPHSRPYLPCPYWLCGIRAELLPQPYRTRSAARLGCVRYFFRFIFMAQMHISLVIDARLPIPANGFIFILVFATAFPCLRCPYARIHINSALSHWRHARAERGLFWNIQQFFNIPATQILLKNYIFIVLHKHGKIFREIHIELPPKCRKLAVKVHYYRRSVIYLIFLTIKMCN